MVGAQCVLADFVSGDAPKCSMDFGSRRRPASRILAVQIVVPYAERGCAA